MFQKELNFDWILFHNGWLESHKNSNHFGSDHKFNETVQALVVSRYKVCGMNANAAS